MKARILIVEDESTLLSIMYETLCDEGFDVITAENGVEGLDAFVEHSPHLVISDIMMPRMDGFNFAKQIKKLNSGIPLIFLTALSSMHDIEEGFDIGADDYIRKPFKMRELILRINALLKRSYQMPCENDNNHVEVTPISIGRFTFDPLMNTLSMGGRVIELSRIESMILAFLVANKGVTVGTSELMVLVWEQDNYYNRNSLHGYIHKIRRHLSLDTSVSIINLRGIGYRLVAP